MRRVHTARKDGEYPDPYKERQANSCGAWGGRASVHPFDHSLQTRFVLRSGKEGYLEALGARVAHVHAGRDGRHGGESRKKLRREDGSVASRQRQGRPGAPWQASPSNNSKLLRQNSAPAMRTAAVTG